MQAGQIQPVHRSEVVAAGLDLMAVGIKESCTQRLQCPHAAIRGTRIAAAHEDLGGPGINGGRDQLAHTVAGGGSRIPLVAGNQPQARSGGHFDDCRSGRFATEHGVVGLDLLSDRTGDCHWHQVAAGSARQGFCGAFAAIGDGHCLDRGSGQGPANPGADGRRDCRRVEGFLESGRGDQDALWKCVCHDSLSFSVRMNAMRCEATRWFRETAAAPWPARSRRRRPGPAGP